MYMSIVESEQEIEKACDAFLGAYKNDLLKIRYKWKIAFEASRETVSLRSLLHTAELMVKNTMTTYEDNVNRFLYVYFRNKPEQLCEEVIEICKVAVKQRVLEEIERIFLDV
ncbi:hypothetical protein HCJ58_04945 [Listeria sp. FSL L7-1509]|uniref:Uncharacterized protein n=1 Tax=Listeria immobilis TaxID=2713502 RepID=A0ABR6SUP0_9LIST|nr:hypothetical protein [Listeria immobilis]MBC1506322.1 hypothetical protein [Listeria immobilis]MBC1509398.1 hypothetical protein [Listeria immobilis]MBC6304529.1 hypothetical protein [Listeria immobilis]MBC6312067.1 hypothetical protein [Listeria immobilis]